MTGSHGQRAGVHDAREGGRAAARQAARRGRVPAQGGSGGRMDGSGGPGRRDARGRPKRTRKRFALAVTASVVVLVVAAVGAIYLKLNGNISTFDANGLSKNRPADSSAGQNILLIGSDSRAGDNSDFAGGTGDIGRSDTTILLHVYSDNKHAVGVSIPRDALVTVPPCLLPNGQWTQPAYNQMFNSAFSVGNTVKGNPACTQNTVEQLTGMRVDHTMVVNFAGFAAMTDAVHGVQVCVPNDIYQGDVNPNLGYKGNLVFAKGLQTVSGTKALDYVRLRHGIGDGSDIGRMQRQQAFLSSLIKKVEAQGLNPTSLLPLANAATKSLTVDPGLGSAEKLISFAMSLKGIDLKNIQFITTPWKYVGARVDLVHPDVDALWATLRADRTLDGKEAGGGKKGKQAPAPSSAPPTAASVNGAGISVAVYNGTTAGGLAAKAAQALQADGFTVTGATTAAQQDHQVTLIEYGSAHLQGAQALAKLFPGAQLEPTATSGINLVLGRDYANGTTGPSVGGAPAAAGPTPSVLPSKDAGSARSAADNPCSNLSYGAGG
ncbi:LCP family protein [Streptomyces sp. ICBB 8177]|uniref:LCP family protein n=1 Tax=Streptomyces sp. ICBB 8177 TaxID=563922 RepID=UPI000D67CEF8|nr:LCP family protein [Streptomyces sp. ICBB 8177]PWI45573.1 transcriptional regulator [Streptomyces sp. ICBB 8177]